MNDAAVPSLGIDSRWSLCRPPRLQLTQPLRRARHYHCERCRRHSGGFGHTQQRIARDGFELFKGAGEVAVFAREGGDARKAFLHDGTSGRMASARRSLRLGSRAGSGVHWPIGKMDHSLMGAESYIRSSLR